MYHRVAEPRHDPWGLCVAPGRFARQLAELKARRTVLPLGELVAQLEAGRVSPRAAAATFDDGYADNALVAKPLLEEAGVPATMFLTSGLLGSERGFWWDELAGMVLDGGGAAELELEFGGTRLAARWPADESEGGPPHGWRAWEPARTARQAAYRQLWDALQTLDAGARADAMAELREQLPERHDPDPLDLPMSHAMAAALPSSLIEVGSHGRSHVPLTALAPDRRDAEIAGGRADLAQLAGGIPPGGFAYPHGSWDDGTRASVERAGYRWAVTTRPALVDPRRFDRYALPRLTVGDWQPGELTSAIAALGV
jgi:peptidoglycan/xylan/chitin deacetylase (PgdA/CDA1 family)